MFDENKNPWQVIDEKIMYDNNWISLTEYNIINPSGGKGIYGKVHFKNIAIGIVALDSEMNTYLVGQFRFTLNAYSWEIPEGGCPEDEEPIIAAKRELLEETGLHSDRWRQLFTMHLSNSVTDECCVVFLAENVHELQSPEPEATEQLQLKKLHIHEALKLVKNGKITDALSVAALLRVELMLLQKQL